MYKKTRKKSKNITKYRCILPLWHYIGRHKQTKQHTLLLVTVSADSPLSAQTVLQKCEQSNSIYLSFNLFIGSSFETLFPSQMSNDLSGAMKEAA